MARSKPSGPETMAQRIDHLIAFTRGTMKIGMLVKTEVEAEEARKILKSKGKKGAVISVNIDTRKQKRIE